MNLKYLKKFFAVLLIGFIFTINTVPVSFAIGDFEPTKTEADIKREVADYEAQKAAEANKIVQLVCPSGSTEFSLDTSTALQKIDQYFLGFTLGEVSKPIACLEKGGKLDEKGNFICDPPKMLFYDPNDPNKALGCIVPPNKVIRQSDVDKIQQTDLSKLKQGNVVYNPKIEIPCDNKIAGGKCPANWKTDIASYIARIYQFGLMIAGLVALGAITYGAVIYTLSAGNMASKEEGKEWMKNAVYGLVLLFGAYLILYTINPDLVKLKTPNIPVFDLDTLLPPADKFIPEGTTPGSALQENSGASGIVGCETSVGGGGGFLSTNVIIDGKSVNSDPNIMRCTHCMEGNDPKDFTSVAKTASEATAITFMKCECKPGLFRMTDGTCTTCAHDVVIDNKCISCSPFIGSKTVAELQSKLKPFSEENKIIIMQDCKLNQLDIQ